MTKGQFLRQDHKGDYSVTQKGHAVLTYIYIVLKCQCSSSLQRSTDPDLFRQNLDYGTSDSLFQSTKDKKSAKLLLSPSGTRNKPEPYSFCFFPDLLKFAH